MINCLRHVPLDAFYAQAGSLRDLLVAQSVEAVSEEYLAGLRFQAHQRGLEPVELVPRFESRDQIGSGQGNFVRRDMACERSLHGRLGAVAQQVRGDLVEIGLGAFDGPDRKSVV